MTMRVKLASAFRYGFTGTPIDRTLQNTHRDFGPVKDGEQERYLSYYGIRRAIRDGATLEVHYISDPVPFQVAPRRGPEPVASAAQDPHRLRPPPDRVRRPGRTGAVPRQAAARPQPAPGHRADQPAAASRQEPERLGLTQTGEYGLFTILRARASSSDEAYLADCARGMVDHLRRNGLLAPGWSRSKGGRMGVARSLLAESWNPSYQQLGFDTSAEDPPFLGPAVVELAKADGAS